VARSLLPIAGGGLADVQRLEADLVIVALGRYCRLPQVRSSTDLLLKCSAEGA